MTQAFEIGVSLALQDGVSDAIGKARRDVAALEHAVRESGISLRSLREVGARSASVSFAEQRKPMAEGPARRAVQEVAPREVDGEAPRLEAQVMQRRDAEGPVMAPPRSQEAAARVETASAPSVEMVVAPQLEGAPAPRVEAVGSPRVEANAVPRIPREEVASQAPAAFEQAAPLREAAPLRGIEGAPGVIATVSCLDVPAYEPGTRALLEAPVAAAPLARLDDAREGAAPVEAAGRANTSDVAEAVGAFGVAPVAAPRKVQEVEAQTQLCAVQMPAPPAAPAMWEAEAAEDAPLAEAQPASRPGADHGLAQHITLVNALRLSGGSAAAPQGENHSIDAGDAVAAPDDDAIPDSSLPASGSLPMMRSRVPQGGVAVAGAREKSNEQVSARDAGPNEGDVFLDGMLVGRWMSRFLNREAERASAGPTGFDARRGRLLPGVTVGG